MKYRVPNEEQEALLRAAGIDPNAVMIYLENEDTIYMLSLHTQDEITLHLNPLKKERIEKNACK